MKIPIKDLQGTDSDNDASSDSDQDDDLPQLPIPADPQTPDRKKTLQKIISEINEKLKKNEPIDLSKYPKLYVVHFRGTHFFKGFFSQQERRDLRHRIQAGTFNEPVYSPAVYELAGLKLGTPIDTEEKKKLISDAILLLKEKFKALQKENEDSSWFGNGKVHDTLLHQHYQRYVNNYEEFRKESKERSQECFQLLPSTANPYVSTADEARHAVYYALGGKAETSQGCLRPSYTQLEDEPQKAKHSKTGYVQIFLHTLESIRQESPLFLSHLHATKKIDIKERVLNERETTFKVAISENHIVCTKVIRYPSFNVKYKYGYHNSKYGISTPSSYSRYAKSMAHDNGGQTGLLEILANHYGSQLTIYAHQFAMQNNGYIVYIGLDGLLSESMPATFEISATRKTKDSSEIDLELEKFTSSVISSDDYAGKLPSLEEIITSFKFIDVAASKIDPIVSRDITMAFSKLNRPYYITTITKTTLETEVAKRGMQCINVKGDGRCFYHAVLHQLQKVLKLDEFEDITANNIIEHAMNEILRNVDYYAAFSVTKNTTDFVNQLLNPGEWADHHMIQAVANALHLRIKIIRNDGKENDIVPSSGQIHHTIYLGYQVGIHYQSLVYATVPLVNPTTIITIPINNTTSTKGVIESGKLSVNALDKKEQRSVMSWSIINKLNLLDFLIEKKADPFIVSNTGKTPFHYACKHGDLISVKKLMQHYPILLNQQDFNGMTGLHLAIYSGHLEITKFLSSQPLLRKDLINKDDETAHDLAIKKGWDSIAKTLEQ